MLSQAGMLECRVGDKLLIELQELGIGIALQGHAPHLVQHPATTATTEHKLLHAVTVQVEAFHRSLSHQCVVHQVFLRRRVEDECVVVLVHEERLHLPFAPFHHLLLAVGDHEQGKHCAFLLLSLVGGIVKEEVVEQLVGSYGHHLAACGNRHRVGCNILHVPNISRALPATLGAGQ